MLKAYRSEGLKHKHITHGFYTRLGGVSEGLYEGLNLGFGSDDDPGNVRQNFALLRDDFGAEHIYSCKQIHSDICHAPPADQTRPDGDALVTDKPGDAIGVLTADCAPVLFYGLKDDGTPVIGAAHAGWKGAIKGVLNSTLFKMVELGAAAETIKAAIGPSIAQKSYEVSEEFFVEFLKQDEANENFFIGSKKDGHYMFDLPGYCAKTLAHAGVKNVEILDLDTYALEEEFFSNRRKTHRNEADYGRQISVIMIKD